MSTGTLIVASPPTEKSAGVNQANRSTRRDSLVLARHAHHVLRDEFQKWKVGLNLSVTLRNLIRIYVGGRCTPED
jgi:hypothetical protein